MVDPNCAPTCPYTLDFDVDANRTAIPAGTNLASVYSDMGVIIRVKKGTSGSTYGRAIAFDSDHPTGGDWDLGTPNSDFGGPGQGSGGALNGAGPNNVTLHNLMILAENTVDANNDGLVDDPDDAVTGARFYFEFAQPACVYSLDLVDLERAATVSAYGANGDVTAQFEIPAKGNNSFQRVEGEICGVTTLLVQIPESGAIDNLVFCPGEGSSCPEGASCDDGDACTLGDVCSGGTCMSGVDQLSCDDGDPCTVDTCDSALGCVSEPDPTCNSCMTETCDGVNNLTLKVTGAASNRDVNETIRVRADSTSGPILFSGTVATYGSFGVPSLAGVDTIYVTVQGANHPSEYVKATFNTNCGLQVGASNGNSYITFGVTAIDYHSSLTSDSCDDGDPTTIDCCNPTVGCTHEVDPFVEGPAGCGNVDPTLGSGDYKAWCFEFSDGWSGCGVSTSNTAIIHDMTVHVSCSANYDAAGYPSKDQPELSLGQPAVVRYTIEKIRLGSGGTCEDKGSCGGEYGVPQQCPALCAGDTECDDGDACTIDTCTDGTCANTASDAPACVAPHECTTQIARFLYRYTGPTLTGTVTLSITASSGATASYTLNGLANGAVVTSTAQNGWTIDSRASNKDTLKSKTTLTLNGVAEVHHTSCSVPYVTGQPAPLNDPKGAPSQLWFVEAFEDKNQ